MRIVGGGRTNITLLARFLTPSIILPERSLLRSGKHPIVLKSSLPTHRTHKGTFFHVPLICHREVWGSPQCDRCSALNVNSHRPPFDNHPPPLLHPPPLPSPTLHCCPPLAFMSQPQSRLTRLPLLSNRRKAPRGKGGLVHGTGRVKSNGTIRRSDSNSSKKPTSKPAPVKPSKQRLVVKQGPTPLYCSDECRLADLNASRSIAGSDYNPDHQSPLPPSVPHNSFPFLAFSASQDSEDDSSSSTDSLVELIDADRCHACLASL